MSLFDGLNLVRSVRPIADPNEGFMQQLLDFEFEQLGVKSANIETQLSYKLAQIKKNAEQL